jgi:hypothetical protein
VSVCPADSPPAKAAPSGIVTAAHLALRNGLHSHAASPVLLAAAYTWHTLRGLQVRVGRASPPPASLSSGAYLAFAPLSLIFPPPLQLLQRDKAVAPIIISYRGTPANIVSGQTGRPSLSTRSEVRADREQRGRKYPGAPHSGHARPIWRGALIQTGSSFARVWALVSPTLLGPKGSYTVTLYWLHLENTFAEKCEKVDGSAYYILSVVIESIRSFSPLQIQFSTLSLTSPVSDCSASMIP